VAPRVAVLHHPRSFFPLDLVHQLGERVDIVWVTDGSSAGDPVVHRLLHRLGPVADLAGLDGDEAAAALAAQGPEGIVSFVDDQVEAAADLADRLGLVYHSPEVARTVVDKRLQRAALDRAGLAGPRYWTLAAEATTAETARLVDQVRYPAVLKPAQGSGSRGILRVESPAQLGRGLAGESGGGGWLIEEYLEDAPQAEPWMASYLSVESVVSGGRTGHAAITGRFPLAEPFRECGNFLPGIIDPDLEQPVLALVDRAVVALGIEDAVIHTEVKLTPDGPMLIEVNGRLGGRPPFLLADVSGVNLFRAACEVALGRPVRVDAGAPRRGVGFWLMLQPPVTAAAVASVSGLEAVAGLAGVDSVTLNRRPGDPVDWRQGTESHVVAVRGRVDDHRTLGETVECIRHQVTIGYH
jgi:biotin carboxylase